MIYSSRFLTEAAFFMVCSISGLANGIYQVRILNGSTVVFLGRIVKAQ